MDDFFNSLTGLISSGVTIAGLSAWLGNVWRDRINSKEKARNEIFIEQLKTEHARQTQCLEHELQIERHAVQLGHAKLIEKRAMFIDECYKLLVDLHEAIYDTIRPDYFGRKRPSIQQAYEFALPKFDAFVESYEKNKIYFSRKTSEKISSFYVAAAKTLDQSRVAMRSGESLGQGETPNLQKLFEKVEYQMHEARKAVEQDFRQLMYVHEN
ncbi:hypothetical protein [Pseudomonas sp. C5pp]|uniref:hypothetical protein n=1 Tax=Pseudomonas sp. C5pp TaxID=1586081 RepID=UPI00057CAFC3|nr:hypothetical protein [Pseudomonas sp. C5pp]KIC83520.1 hypothetical protein RR51_06180 [Pseudomonas sp. C5pp]